MSTRPTSSGWAFITFSLGLTVVGLIALAVMLAGGSSAPRLTTLGVIGVPLGIIAIIIGVVKVFRQAR